MAAEKSFASTSVAGQINLSAHISPANITSADVIPHDGVNVVSINPPGDLTELIILEGRID
jgi:hypothetical protein